MTEKETPRHLSTYIPHTNYVEISCLPDRKLVPGLLFSNVLSSITCSECLARYAARIDDIEANKIKELKEQEEQKAKLSTELATILEQKKFLKEKLNVK